MTENLAPVATQVAETPSVQEPSNPSTEVKTPDAQAGNGESQNSAETTTQKEEVVPLKRVNRMRAALGDKERQLQEAKNRIAELEKVSQAAKPLDDKPNPDKYENQDDYIEALADWKLAQKEKAKQQEQGSKETEAQKAEKLIEFGKMKVNFETKEADFRKSEPNYDKAAGVVNDFMSLANRDSDSFKTFSQTLLTADNPPALINFLGNNPAEIVAMFKMTPFEVEDRLTTLIEQISDAPKQTAQVNGDDEPEPKAVLPTPPSALTGSTRSKKSIDQMTGRELLEKYAKG